MAQSLVKLTLESNQYERNIRQAQKAWNDFTKSIGLSASKFTAAGVAIGAMTGALKVAKDAFFKNEQQLDEWNRTVEASKSVYNGFLNALNTGDISGFLSNVNIITQAARDAYDALDELIHEKMYSDKVSIIRYRSWNGNGDKDLDNLYRSDKLHLNDNGYITLDRAITKEILNQITTEHNGESQMESDADHHR